MFAKCVCQITQVCKSSRPNKEIIITMRDTIIGNNTIIGNMDLES